ncbi:MAG: hypothetical protein K8F91_27430 [Candidatus Obscuribacterales bacterium]|nr:hypothetical protein [Candidatus Obscuribacterales bacterium]
MLVSRLIAAGVDLVYFVFFYGWQVPTTSSQDPDTCWFLAIGKKICQTDKRTGEDPFSYTIGEYASKNDSVEAYQKADFPPPRSQAKGKSAGTAYVRGIVRHESVARSDAFFFIVFWFWRYQLRRHILLQD